MNGYTSMALQKSFVLQVEELSPTAARTLGEYCVVIPARNASAFIGAAISSVQRQTIPPAEIVVVDDGSTDATTDVCRTLGVRVEQLHSSHGPSAARNRGVAATSAPVVAFLDADDEWLPAHAQHLLQALAAEGVVFAASDAERFGSETGLVPHGLSTQTGLDLPDLFILENPIIQSAVMILRSAFDAAGGYDEQLRYSEDYDLWTRMLAFGRFGYVNAPTVRRRMHAEQLTSTNRPELVRSWSQVRRRALKPRLENAAAEKREMILSLLDQAIQSEVEWAVWTGNRAMLKLVRAELELTDSELGLGRRLRTRVGGAKSVRRVWQDVRCAGRGIFNSAMGRTQ